MPPICFPVSGCVCGCVGEYFGEVMKLQSDHMRTSGPKVWSPQFALFAVGQLLQISYKAAFSFLPKKKKKKRNKFTDHSQWGGQEPHFENHFIKMT